MSEAYETVLNHLRFHKALISETDGGDRISRYVTMLNEIDQGMHVALRDPFEKAVAAAIARKINWGKWNKRLSADISQGELGRLAGIRSRHGVRGALNRLEVAGYIRWAPRPGRGGCRFWFTEKCR